MGLYLTPYAGKGTKGEPFRPVGLEVDGSSTIDIRLDPTKGDGDGIPYALLWLPAGSPDPKGAEKIAEDYGESSSALIKALANTKLGLDFSRDQTIQDLVETILLRPAQGLWNPLKPCNGRIEAWLGSGDGKRRWVDFPVLAGGSVSDSFTRANETPLASPWTRLTGGSGNINLSTNACTASASGDKLYYYSNAGGWNADHDSQWLYATAVGSHDWGPAVRIGSGGAFSAYIYHQYTGQRELAKIVSGTYSSVENASGATGTSNTYKIAVAGSTITYSDNGTPNANSPATDSSLTTAGNGAGVFLYETGGSIDDFAATGEIAAGGRTTKNTRSTHLGVEVGMDWRSQL